MLCILSFLLAFVHSLSRCKTIACLTERMEIFRAARVLVTGIKDIGYETWFFSVERNMEPLLEAPLQSRSVKSGAHTHTHTTFQSPALALVWKCVLEEHLSEALECVVLFLFSCSFADKCRNIYPPLYN